MTSHPYRRRVTKRGLPYFSTLHHVTKNLVKRGDGQPSKHGRQPNEDRYMTATFVQLQPEGVGEGSKLSHDAVVSVCSTFELMDYKFRAFVERWQIIRCPCCWRFGMKYFRNWCAWFSSMSYGIMTPPLGSKCLTYFSTLHHVTKNLVPLESVVFPRKFVALYRTTSTCPTD